MFYIEALPGIVFYYEDNTDFIEALPGITMMMTVMKSHTKKEE